MITRALLLIVCSGVAVTALAGDPTAAPPVSADKGLFDSIWSHAVLFEDKENPFVQKIAFTGRAQFEYALIDSTQGDFNDLLIRRWRSGLKASLFEGVTFHAEAELDFQNADPVYSRLTDAYLGWAIAEPLELKVGKQGVGFTLDGMTSSKELITIDRSNVSNNLWFGNEYMPGITLAGEKDHWIYEAGIFSSGALSPEFGNFDGSAFGLLTAGYDFAETLQVEEALLAFNYVYQDPNPLNTFTRPFEHIGSLNFRYDNGQWGVRSDLTAGAGYGGQSDVFGAVLMPFYHITDKLQAVTRYTFLSSEDTNGVRLGRYESSVVSGRGDEYHEFYAGLNYYLYGHKLKLQTGLNYATMSDSARDGGAYDGWGLTTGLRISW